MNEGTKENPPDLGIIRNECMRLAKLTKGRVLLADFFEFFQSSGPQALTEAERKHPTDSESALKYYVALIARYYLADEWYPEANYANIAHKPKRTPHPKGKKCAVAHILNFIRKNYPEAFEFNPDLEGSPNVKFLPQWEEDAYAFGQKFMQQ